MEQDNSHGDAGGSTPSPNTPSCLVDQFPEVAAEWHPTRNGERSPSWVTPAGSRLRSGAQSRKFARGVSRSTRPVAHAAGASRADASHARARDPQPMEVVAMAHLGKGWVSCWMRSGRYTYRKVVVHTANPAPDACPHARLRLTGADWYLAC